MILLALLIGVVLGGLTATAACALWAFRAMHPHDEPRQRAHTYNRFVLVRVEPIE